jgi:uncharacterized protein YjbI with pentapeptide repeats
MVANDIRLAEDPVPPGLAQLMEDHRHWLASGGREGAAANFSGRDLRGANLAGLDLTEADLTGADVSGASFERAVLRNARLAGLRATAATRWRDADLTGATGLTGREFAGADLTGVKLPAPLDFDARLQFVAASASNARPIFLFLLVFSLFILLTVLSTSDAALLSNARSAVLPNLSTAIPAASLFWVAPILLVALALYFYLQLAHIGAALEPLPAIMPDGTPLDQRTDPWLVANLLHLRDGWTGLRFEEAVTIYLLWGVVPTALVAVWWRYLPFRDWFVSGLHLVLIVGCSWGAMRMFERTVSRLSDASAELPHRRGVTATLAVVLTGTSLLAAYAPFVFPINPRRLPLLVTDLRDADLKNTSLKRKDLRFASARKASFLAADLRDAQLARADIQRADFRGADLEKADLSGSDSDAASFADACLRRARLDASDLEDADFRGAYLGRASLRQALLTRADFTGANLQGADLGEADLRGARFRDTVFACFVSHVDDPARQHINCASLAGADLTGAQFIDVDLRRVEGLTQQQTAAACGANVMLPAEHSMPVCETPPDTAAARTAAENPCAHEMREDRAPE